MPPTPRGFSVGTATSLSTSYTSIAIKEVAGTDPRSRDVPEQCFLSRLQGVLSATTSATKVTWYLSTDAAGDQPITDEVESDLIDQGTGSNLGGFGALIEASHSRTALTVLGTLYIRAKVDAGTPTLTPYLFWER